MCNLYSHTTNVQAIIDLVGALGNGAGNLPPQPNIFPDYPAPIVRTAADGERELVMVYWGMPSLLEGIEAQSTTATIRTGQSPLSASSGVA